MGIMSQPIYAVIMAGGRGERLWPLTAQTPKQFLPLLSDRTLLQETAQRLTALIPPQNLYVVTSANWEELVRQQLPDAQVIVEAVGRNTAPCIGFAALVLEQRDPQAVMIALPADHAVGDVPKFRSVLQAAVEMAEQEPSLVTLGIVPTEPATGYGYVQRGPLHSKIRSHSVHRLLSFTEKPDRERAESYLASGDHYWNGGIFIGRVSVILNEIAQHMPDFYGGLKRAQQHGDPAGFDAEIARVYQNQPSISFDYAVMEKTDKGLVIPADVGWSDIGDWAALAKLLRKDADGNSVRGPARHFTLNTHDTLILSQSEARPLIATVGVNNLVIIDTGEALLVLDKSHAQAIRKLVEAL